MVRSAEKELGYMDDAHEGMVWDLSWHPLGHMLVSGSNDRSTLVYFIYYGVRYLLHISYFVF